MMELLRIARRRMPAARLVAVLGAIGFALVTPTGGASAQQISEVVNLRVTAHHGFSRVTMDMTRPVDFTFGPVLYSDILAIEFRGMRWAFPAGRRQTSAGIVGEYAFVADAGWRGRLLLLNRLPGRIVNIQLLGPRQTRAGYRLIVDVAITPRNIPISTLYGYVPWATRIGTQNAGVPPGRNSAYILHRVYRDTSPRGVARQTTVPAGAVARGPIPPAPTARQPVIRPPVATRQVIPQLKPRAQAQPPRRPAPGLARQVARAPAPPPPPPPADPRPQVGDATASPAPLSSPPAPSTLAPPPPATQPSAARPPPILGPTDELPGSPSYRLQLAVAAVTGRPPPSPPAGIPPPEQPLADVDSSPAPLIQTAELGDAPEDDLDLAPDDYGGSGAIEDPIEGVNRVFFYANDLLDQAILRPIAWTYGKVMPEPLKAGVRNAFKNVQAPVVLANNLLQFEFDNAATTLGRFVINSTIGIAGVWDAASEFGLAARPADFGQTLHSYDIGSGPYLVVPLLGPTNVRDLVGNAVDGLMHPFNYVLNYPTQLAIKGGSVVSARESVIQELDEARESTVDYYGAIRSFYWQNRQANLRQMSEESTEASCLS